MIRGNIASIKTFAIHDGPGIRTTVFFKGCPLHCRWCHNPEMISSKPELAFIEHKCIGCGDCADLCPNHRLENGLHIFDRANCRGCGRCASACLSDALVFYGELMTPETLAALVLEDLNFFEHSSGGVTVSGGEPLLQADFCARFFAVLKQKQIHIAVDTCGKVPWRNFQKVLPSTDLFLYDIKHLNDSEHRKWTGCGKRLILENLKRLALTGKPIEIRMPVIPGFNSSESDLCAVANFILSLDRDIPVRPLKYHDTGHSKYAQIGMPNTMPPATGEEEKLWLRACEIFRQRGLKIPI